MGANFCTREYPGEYTTAQVETAFELDQRNSRYENGNSYSGDIGCISGLEITSKVFDSIKEAETYLENNTEKWQDAKAVRFRNVRRECLKRPTFSDGHPTVLCMGKDRSYQTYYKDGELCFAAANELPTVQKAKLRKLWTAYRKANDASNAALHQSHALLTRYNNLKEPFTAYSSLRAARNKVVKTLQKLQAANQALQEYDKELCAKLYEYSEVDGGLRWLVGGWAPS